MAVEAKAPQIAEALSPMAVEPEAGTPPQLAEALADTNINWDRFSLSLCRVSFMNLLIISIAFISHRNHQAEFALESLCNWQRWFTNANSGCKHGNRRNDRLVVAFWDSFSWFKG